MSAAERLAQEANASAAPPGAPKESWGSAVGVILAVAGSAVGLGNFLRFPGLAVENGGGAFMIPYFIALLLLGIPLGWAEWAMGRYGGQRGLHSSPAILGIVGGGRVARYFGVLGALIPIIVVMYYALIEAWCLQYAIAYATGSIDLGADPAGQVAASQAFFTQVAGTDANGVLFTTSHVSTLWVFLAVFAMNLWFVQRGLSGGIELVCRYAMPAMAVCAMVVLIRVLTLGAPDPANPERDVMAGLGFMWNPNLEKLGDFKTWLAAAGQVFFTLSVGFGVILNYASYLSKKDDVVLSGLTASATNEVFEVGFGGMITVTAAFVFLGASGAVGGTFGLGFNALPVVFAKMGAFGNVVGAIWFFMLFLAAITSSLSMFQPAKAFFQECLGISGGRAVVIVALIAGTGSLWVLYFSANLLALDTMDFWVGTIGLFLLGALEVACFSWILGVDRGLEEAHQGAKLRIPGVFRFILKYVAPAYLLFVAVGFSIQSLPGYLKQVGDNSVVAMTIAGIVAVFALLAAVTYMGELRWRAAGIDLDGVRPLETGEGR